MHLAKYKGLEVNPAKITESITVKPFVSQKNHQLFLESKIELPRAIYPRIEAIHEGRTRNYNRYLAEKLKGDVTIQSGVYSWLHPYPKPVIYNHDIESDATGRIYNAAFSEYTRAGRKGIILIPKITDPIAIEKILDGRLLTVSIGATTDSATCSYCGQDIIAEGWCGHEKGEVIDDTTVEWIAGNLWFNELSWVNEPADQDAQVIDPGPITVAETYGYDGKELIDLSKKPTEWVLTRKVAMREGLLPTEEMKGESNLKTAEELQTLVDQLTTELEEVTSKKAELESQLEEAQGQVETIKAELAEKTTALEEKEAELKAKVEELSTVATAKEAAEEKITQLEEQVETLEAERTSLMEKNTELSADVHKSIAERVVDLKVLLNKTEREGALEKHLNRSTESLQDTLVDLLEEAKDFTPGRVTEKIDPPANITKGGKEGNTIIDGAGPNGTGQTKELTTEQVLARLFGSRTNIEN